MGVAMKVGQKIEVENAGWTFGGDVANTFVDHIKVSVPLYESGHDLICQLSDYFVADGSTSYEIGVSTGELLKKLALQNTGLTAAAAVSAPAEGAIQQPAANPRTDPGRRLKSRSGLGEPPSPIGRLCRTAI